jgi:CTP:molybdopterin cytidylyltransferase MocA
VVVVVDDSTAIETGLIEEDDDAEWVLLGDEPAVDEHRRDELVERFETRRVGTTVPESDDDIVEEEDELEPDAEEY